MLSRIIRMFCSMLLLSVLISIQPLTAQEVPCDTPYCRNQERWNWEPIGVDALAWHPDGDQFAIGGDFGIRMYTDTLELLGNYVTEPVEQLVWSPDGRLLAIASDERVLIWDAQRRVEILALDDTTYPVSWHPNGTRVAVHNSEHSQILVYDLESVEVVAKYTTDTEGYVFPIQSWNTSGGSVIFIDRFRLFIWSPDTDDLVQIEPLPFHIDWGNWWGNVWSQDKGSILITPLDKAIPGPSIGIWDYMNGEYRLGTYEIHAIPLSFAWSPDERYIALIGDREANMLILDADTFSVVQTINFVDSWSTRLDIHQCPDSIDQYKLGGRIAWHPDSRRVLVANPCRLTIVTVDI